MVKKMSSLTSLMSVSYTSNSAPLKLRYFSFIIGRVGIQLKLAVEQVCYFVEKCTTRLSYLEVIWQFSAAPSQY